MQISVSGQHFTTGDALQNYVSEKLIHLIQKYFDDALSANVHFTKDGTHYLCDIIINDNTGKQIIVKNQQSSNEVYQSFDSTILKVEKQLTKYKSRLKDRHNRVKPSSISAEGTKYVINASYEEENASAEDNPVIIAEKPTEIKTLTVGDAVMEMDLNNLPSLMFQNVKNGRINIVYYRKDGNISWVDSK
jgi:ribosomal subunit interface protein